MPSRFPSVAVLLLAAAVVCFDAALWLPCVSEPSVTDGPVYSGAHLIFVAVGSLYSLVSSAWVTDHQLQSWWLVPIANVVFLAAPWIWTAHPRSRAADHAVLGMKIATGLFGLWAVANIVVMHTGMWAQPAVQTVMDALPSMRWRLEPGSLAWIASMVLVTLALVRRRRDQYALLARWERRVGARSLDDEPASGQLAALPPGVRALVVDAHRLRLEFDAMGPIDGWRVRLLGDWITQLCALPPGDYTFMAQRNVWPQQLVLAVPPTPNARSGPEGDRLDELIRVDDALHHFTHAVLSPPASTYR